VKIRTFSELSRLRTFEERYQYLRLTGTVGESTFGFDRYLNQIFYGSKRWRRTRDGIIVRDNSCDLGMRGYEIYGQVYIHHLNPISMDEVEDDDDSLYEPELLICTSYNTHLAIHFGSESLLPQLPIERRPNDTCPWK